MRILRLAVITGLILLSFSFFTSPTYAATLSVSTDAELIAAINTANGNGQADTIILLNDITLTQAIDVPGGFGLPNITSDITLQGNGYTLQRASTICPPQASATLQDFRFFRIQPTGTLTVENIILRNGCANGLGNRGGSFQNFGTLNLSYVRVVNSIAVEIGGVMINALGRTINIRDSSFENNNALVRSSVIDNGEGTVNIYNSAFIGNTSTGDGGPIINFRGTLRVVNSTFANNSIGSTAGIAIDNRGFGANSTILNSTFVGNRSTAGGWAIANVNGTTITLQNNTLTDNLNVLGSASCSATFIDTGGNISDDSTCNFSQPTSQNNTNPLVAGLANNGGFSQTYALQTGSPALDTAVNAGCSDGATVANRDQRGIPRPLDGNADATADCDRGAFEATGIVPTITFESATSTAYEPLSTHTVNLIVTNPAGGQLAGTAMQIYLPVTGTATKGVDYTFPTVQAVSFTVPAAGTSQTIPITLSNLSDAVSDAGETITLPLFMTAALLPGTTTTHTVTIQESLPPTPTPIPTSLPATPAPEEPAPSIGVFDPAISKIGFLVPGQVGITGELLEWQVTVSNTGNAAGQNVTVTDNLPETLRLERVEAPGATVVVANQLVSVTYPTLPPGESRQFSIFTTVEEGLSITNTACIGAECATGLLVRSLPNTGETPRWRGAVLVGSMSILLAALWLFWKRKGLRKPFSS